MTRQTRVLRLAILTRLKSMNRQARLPGMIILVSLARLYRLHILNSMIGTARHTRMNRTNKNNLCRTITMERLTWRDRIARLYRLTILDRIGI